MPKSAVEIQVCDICGAEVREGSQFCYNCGGSLGRPSAATENIVPSGGSPESGAAASPKNGGPAKNGTGRHKAGRKRAANRGPVEVVWEPRKGISTGYIAAAVIMLLFASVLLVAAFWLR